MKKLLFCLAFVFLYISEGVACTVVYYSNDTLSVAGNNEDFIYPYTQMIFYPPEEGKYGCVFFGFTIRDNMNFGEEQGGMNDQGLFCDGLSTSPNPVLNSKEKPTYYGNLMRMILEKCATVEQALEVIDKYNLGVLMTGQIMVGDAHGDAAIIEGDVVIRKKGRYQICTNFYQSQVQDQNYPCNRYITAKSMLDSVKSADVEFVAEVMNATHIEGEGGTLYSTVYDLKKRKIYIYHFHDYENVAQVDLIEELKKGNQEYQLADLFPENLEYLSYKDDLLEKFEILERDRVKLLDKFKSELKQSADTTNAGSSPAEILNEHLECIGGRENIEKVKSMIIRGLISVPLSDSYHLDGILKSYHERPLRMYRYVEIKGFSINEKFVNGDICWDKGSYTKLRLLKGDEKYDLILESMIEDNRPEIYAEKRYLGIEDINGFQCHKLYLRTKEGFSIAKYFDIESGLLRASLKAVKTEYSGPKKIFTYYEDYKRVNGIKLAGRIREYSTKQDIFAIKTDYYTIEFDYEINKDIPEEYFDIPKELSSSAAERR